MWSNTKTWKKNKEDEKLKSAYEVCFDELEHTKSRHYVQIQVLNG